VVKILKQKLVWVRNLLIFKKYDFLAKANKTTFRVNPEADFVVSIACYPKRDPLLPAVYEALNNQTSVPRKWILVLSEEDYPQGLPKHLIKLENLGLEILWVKDNPYAVKKLIPVIEKYPHLSIITLDDDIIYHSSLIKGLLVEANKSPNSVIGYVGKAMLKKDKQLEMFYRERKPASNTTAAEQVYLIGWGGIYYPPKSLDERVLHMEAVHRIVPGRGSDFWFWAAAHAVDTKQLCLGVPTSYNLGIAIPQNNETKPKDQPGTEVILERFQMAIDYFGIREKLLSILPDEENKI
jgi:hypothetical protein